MVQDLSVSFGGVKAVVDLSFAAEPGRITSIIGPNGAGKSTVLNLASGFYRPDRGSIQLAGREIAGLASHSVARAGIGRTYQTTQLFGQMSVIDNVLVALRRGRLAIGELLAPDRDPERAALGESLLAFVGYDGPLTCLAGTLPHVDKRLVEIARALAMAPSVLALDEPAAGLAPGDTSRLSELLRKVAATGITVLLVEHDMKLVMTVSDRVVVLDAGQKIAEGAPVDVARNPLVLKEKSFKIKAAADEKVDGKDAACIEATGPDGKDFKLYFDKTTGLPVKEVARVVGFSGEELTQESYFKEFKAFDGFKTATKVDIKHDG